MFLPQAFLSNYLLETLHGCVQMYCQRYKISVKSIVGHAAPVPWISCWMPQQRHGCYCVILETNIVKEVSAAKFAINLTTGTLELAVALLTPWGLITARVKVKRRRQAQGQDSVWFYLRILFPVTSCFLIGPVGPVIARHQICHNQTCGIIFMRGCVWFSG